MQRFALLSFNSYLPLFLRQVPLGEMQKGARPLILATGAPQNVRKVRQDTFAISTSRDRKSVV